MIHIKLFKIKKIGITLKRDTKAYNYKYATLDQIQDKLYPILQEYNLLIYHFVENNTLITELFDIEDGELLRSKIEFTSTKAQDRGSEITYYRRYNLLCLFDLEVEDDDGQQATFTQQKIEEPKKWLNYETFREIVECGNTTETQIADTIKKDGYILSGQAKIAVRHYIETGKIDKNLFFKKP